MSIKEHGISKFGRLIDQNIHQAIYLADRIRATPYLELLAEPTLDIICFRICPPHLTDAEIDKLNQDIMLQLQEDGIAALSDTRVGAIYALRCAIANHRTQIGDIDLLLHAIATLIKPK